ncbi:MAG: type VI secretion system baseplate subunit TssG [Deltaproteobacteria bacterium HGW-Deltaproteobacteria-15]|jgi:type VI secretion system protein ImpH|nr:MAG: type VI secretion system baseplate subunit TssG [Deltaproteobacteria bacterium HGW-Deltaproteobacteria-15]
MAPQDRREVLGIKKALLEKGRDFSFIQAERLLRYFLSKSEGKRLDDERLSRAVRVRPHLSLEFPETDLTSVETADANPEHFLITATFLGLYGVSSPLPTFYTEDLMDEESEDMSVTRDFLDIINAPIYPLFFRCWSKYRQHIKIVEEEDPAYLERLFCLLGLGTEKLRKGLAGAEGLIRYIGLFNQFPRSALSLATILSDAFGQTPVEIIQCVKSHARIPEDQLLCLGIRGGSLGIESYLGHEIADRMSAFQVRVGPLKATPFRTMFPDSEGFRLMNLMIRLYLDQPLEWDVRVLLTAGEARPACLGGPHWCRLGWDTWVFSGETLGEVEANFQRLMSKEEINVQYPD